MPRTAQDGERGPERARQVVRVGDVEELIRQLPGVIAARLVVNDWGGVEEVHVLASSERSPKQIVRDIESSLHARWGLRLDHRKISVAQVADAGTSLPPMRPRLLGVTVANDLTRARIRATVVLGLPNDEEARIEGHAEGPNLPGHHLRMVGLAAVEALNAAIRTDHRLGFEDVRVVSVGAFDVAVVVVTLEGGRDEQRVLAGAMPVDGDPVEATVKAVLQATNRFMERHIVRRVARLPRPEESPADAAGEAAAAVSGAAGEAAAAEAAEA